MSQKDQHIDLFDKYQTNQLSENERIAFDERIQNDAEFSQAFEQYIAEVNVIKAISAGEEMQSIMNSDSKISLKPTIRRWLIPVSVAAAIALFLIFTQISQRNHNSLFNEYFTPYPDAVTSRNVGNGLSNALHFYSQQEYAKALEGFEALAESDTVEFYEGICLLALKRPEEALDKLNTIGINSIFRNQSQWFKGLSFLLLEESDSTIKSFEKIKALSKYKKQSLELIKRLQ
ncbi:hypothetical protein [Roseivirga misakiensis]|uniref:DUF3379 domain-containing protein n=1 Tax=Roseivirga misakiensis TaxID=1563681 RepID=A0A1E5T682_9BACT|nr:hypothetical protein [Roseivirga misakiensis]OEK06902.1 hypothetical protein BFP71_04405 [Roseivirga misakiensis]